MYNFITLFLIVFYAIVGLSSLAINNFGSAITAFLVSLLVSCLHLATRRVADLSKTNQFLQSQQKALDTYSEK